MTKAAALILGPVWTNDTLACARVLAEWMGAEPPVPPIDEYYLVRGEIEVYLEWVGFDPTPEHFLTCSMPPDVDASMERFEALVSLFVASDLTGFLEHSVLDDAGEYVTPETRREF